MTVASFAADDMRATALQLFDPCILLVNYTLLQYLTVFYWARRRERRVILLFSVGSVGVACLVPFANTGHELTTGLNDVSESCCALAFLIQITILGRDLNKKIKFKTVLYLTWLAELLIAADLAMIIFTFVSVAKPQWIGERHESLEEAVPNALENLNLAFIFFFRYFYIAQSLGWRDIVKKRKREMLWFLLFATHEVPFTILEDATGLSGESMQAMWNRVTLAGCLYVTATAKLRNLGSSNSHVDSTNSRVQVSRRSSAGRIKRTSTMRRNSNVYVAASTRTASMDHTSVVMIKKELGA